MSESELRELIEEWRDKIKPVGGLEQHHQTLSDCADELEEVLDDDGASASEASASEWRVVFCDVLLDDEYVTAPTEEKAVTRAQIQSDGIMPMPRSVSHMGCANDAA